MLLLWGTTLSLPGQELREDYAEDGPEQAMVLSLNLTNLGAGFHVHYYRGNEQQQMVFGVDFHSVKSVHETPVSSAFGDQGKDFVYGKQNYFYIFTPSVGIQKNLIPAGGGNLINVRVGLQAGPAIGLLNPYYVEIFEPIRNPGNGQAYYGYRIVAAYNPAEHTYDEIIGKAGLLASKFKIKAQVGVSLRANALIDFTRNPRYVSGLQIGLNADLFANKVPIMAEFGNKIQNQQYFLAGNLGLVFGSRWR
ncbi:MAG: hypothetical protein D6730_02745 [Bacteroidetes bacterium]|nr:MAG: hypothetical protein D6730_02745 [Bacteroidota bacterium]